MAGHVLGVSAGSANESARRFPVVHPTPEKRLYFPVAGSGPQKPLGDLGCQMAAPDGQKPHLLTLSTLMRSQQVAILVESCLWGEGSIIKTTIRYGGIEGLDIVV
jgi:hypothetical protein